jgi:hypothetical protein
MLGIQIYNEAGFRRVRILDKGPRRCLWLTHKKEARLEYAGDFFGRLEAYPGAGMLTIGTLAEVATLLIPKM